MAPPLPDIPRLIGHRGAKSSAPENTLSGIRRAHAEGARWIEFDVKLTADSHPVLMHDETLERTTDGAGLVRSTPLAALRRLDAGSWFSKDFEGERVPTLVEALELMAALGLGFNLEIKPCPGRAAETAGRALAAVVERWPADRPLPVISSFDAEALRAARAAAPDLPRGLLVKRLAPDWQARAQALGCRSVHPRWQSLREDQVRAVKAAGYPLLAWSVEDPLAARRLIDWGVDSLITGTPAALARALDLGAA